MQAIPGRRQFYESELELDGGAVERLAAPDRGGCGVTIEAKEMEAEEIERLRAEIAKRDGGAA